MTIGCSLKTSCLRAFAQLTVLLAYTHTVLAQNSLVGDGFGGRLWYAPTNYSVGSYSAYTICGDACGKNGQLYGWGANQYGQLGNGTQTGVTIPIAVPGMTNLKYYTAGYCMAAITSDNGGWVWGSPFTQAPISLVPLKILTDVKFVDCGTYLAAFVKNDGTVWSVGSNINGCFGNGSIATPTTAVPSQMTGVTSAVRVAVGQLTTTVLMKDGTVWATGANTDGGLGNNSPLTTSALSPVQVSGLSNIIDIKSNQTATIALDSAGNVYAWGSNGWGSIGNGGAYGLHQNQVVPVKIKGLSNIVAISGCDDGIHFMALDANHNCWAWGYSAYGQLGTGNTGIFLTPVLVQTGVIDIMAGENFSYIVKSDGTLWCTGASNYTFTFIPGSIWLNLSNVERDGFTQIDPTIPPLNLCPPIVPLVVEAEAEGCGAIQVNALGGTLPFSYDIGTGPQSGSLFNGLAPGTYTATVSDNAGCTGSVPVTVTKANGIKGIQLDIVNPTCTVPNGSIDFASVNGGIPPFSYSLNDSASSNLQLHSHLDSGTYNMVVADGSGCTYDSSIVLSNIGFPPTPANAGPDQSITGSATVLSGNQPLSGTGYWSLVSGAGIVESPNNPNTAIVDLKPGKDVFQWTITSDCGVSEDTVSILVPIGTKGFYVPSAFTPNNDGHNDFFNVITSYNCVVERFQVFDRWGRLVYSNSPFSLGWDGTFAGQPQPTGNYVWLLKGLDASGRVVNEKGTVQLVR